MKPAPRVAVRGIFTTRCTNSPCVTTASGSSAPSSTISCTVATVHEIVELGALDPEAVVTQGLFVQRVVKIPRTATRGAGFKAA